MSLKLKPIMPLLGLSPCSGEKIKSKRWCFNNPSCLEKSSCSQSHFEGVINERGHSGIGWILTAFFLFILVLLPINLCFQEVAHYKQTLHEHQIASELTCFNILIKLNGEAYSESNLQLSNVQAEIIKTDLLHRLSSKTELKHFQVSLVQDMYPTEIKVHYSFEYVTKFILKNLVVKEVDVSLSYALPLDR